LSDALNLLESVPEKDLTAHLRLMRANALRRLQGDKPRDAESTLISTGIPVLDRVRTDIAAGN
jgi:hypothetical protein